MAEPTNAELRSAIQEILKGADLDSLSARKVRHMLEEKYSTDLADRKKEVDDLMMSVIDETESKQSDEEEKEEEEEKVVTKPKTPQKKTTAKVSVPVSRNGKRSKSESEGSELSDDEDLSDKETPKKKTKQAVPKKLTVIKAKPSAAAVNESDEEASEEEEKLDDATLAQKLQEEENTRSSRHRSAKRPSKPKKEPVKRKKTEGKGVTAYSRACLLSEDLANIMGTDKMARNEVVKRMWQIVRERNLEDPKNKQFMICDDELLKVFGKKRVRTFGMMKYLKGHIKDEKDVAGR